jgi:protocatechuate 3,4-dioxygenase beta subunit
MTASALGAAVVTITLTVCLVGSVSVTDADLVPGALVTVWQDDAGRHVEVTPLREDDDTPAMVEAP